MIEKIISQEAIDNIIRADDAITELDNSCSNFIISELTAENRMLAKKIQENNAKIKAVYNGRSEINNSGNYFKKFSNLFS